MRKWVAALTALAVAGAAGALVLRHRAQVQRERDRTEALTVATRFLTTWQAGKYAVERGEPSVEVGCAGIREVGEPHLAASAP